MICYIRKARGTPHTSGAFCLICHISVGIRNGESSHHFAGSVQPLPDSHGVHYVLSPANSNVRMAGVVISSGTNAGRIGGYTCWCLLPRTNLGPGCAATLTPPDKSCLWLMAMFVGIICRCRIFGGWYRDIVNFHCSNSFIYNYLQKVKILSVFRLIVLDYLIYFR